ncbi:MAG TPA: hypothetical protein VKA34_12730 [Balneolales bacterium]|nr:hypothetical protein [Balneolales bacterium]
MITERSDEDKQSIIRLANKYPPSTRALLSGCFGGHCASLNE